MIKGHGSDLYKYSGKIIADFSSNVWYKGMPEELILHLKYKLENIVHYPEPDAGKLAVKISNQYNLKTNKVLVTNGATEAFYLIAHLFTAKNSYIVYPSFSEYEDACKVYNHTLQYININEINSKLLLPNNSILWLGNPNNPDGVITSKNIIENILKCNTTSFFIIDEAYNELCVNSESVVGLLDNYSNLIITHSLTKSFAIPGIRLGYILASEEIISGLSEITMPWSVNSLAIEAGLFLLSRYKEFLPNKNNLIEESRYFQKEISSIEGLEIIKSDCNYFLIKLENGKASDLKEYLAHKKGLLIRDASNFKGLTDSHFRVAIQGNDNNNLLLLGIKQWLNHS